MNILTKEQTNAIARELSIALVKFSKDNLSTEEAERIAEIVLEDIDLDNPTLAHKGINWLAKDILRQISR
ncbi:hypothetical protein [Tenuibacillus multivorans]|uniref:Uncharacterized protein n=1 Tax=Tenuibacillus multivorans TaxID=237069 RepID=A0A1H0DED2_9BACI|nr:hypothetical protein [Tenuibacillus multivorans]GEL76582.1 hypothetical protein TMU01_08170 [Tenuibacillus multivorans]SDN68627.1 hypothetical protein SAMN05216498_2843 [Tenuibacillus multivorans]